MNNFDIKYLIKKIEIESNISSYSAIARRAGITNMTIYRITHGRISPTIKTASRIMNAIHELEKDRKKI